MELDTLHVVGRLGQSGTMEELASRIEAVSMACYEAGPGSKGKVTVTFEIGNDPKYARNLVYVRESFKSTFPDRYESKGAAFFVGEDGGLFDRDPMNPELPMAVREVPNQQPEVRHVDDEAAVRRAK